MKKRRKKDRFENILYGIILLLIGAIGLLYTATGGLGYIIFNLLTLLFGHGAYLALAYIILWGISLILDFKYRINKRSIAFGLIVLAGLTYHSIPKDTSLVGKAALKAYFDSIHFSLTDRIDTIGGFVGNFTYTLCSFTGTVTIARVFCGIILLVAILLFISSLKIKIKPPKTKEIRIQPIQLKPVFVKKEKEPITIEQISRQKEKEEKTKAVDLKPFTAPQPAPVEKKPETKQPEMVINSTAVEDKNYRYPPIDTILDTPLLVKKNGNQKNAVDKWHILQSSLESFGLPSTLNNYNIGPSVTQFEIVPGENFNIRKYASVQENLKMDMAVTDVRIEAPIPGKKAVGIEIPNAEKIPVRLKELFSEMPPEIRKNPLAFCVGKDLSGQCVYGLIDKMPHLLIAGQTGSGKSVCMNSILLTILLKAKPEEVKLLLIDPKKVEFKFYEQAPHLICPIITDTSKASSALDKLIKLMEERYEQFARLGVRDINEYNAKAPEKMYRIVCAIDEIADLMATHRNEVEGNIMRLASLARASGIFLILATQRPSTDVITGVIKANIPSRIAFKVASSYDSRTILDQTGAECLYGYGDMLYNPSGSNNPKRVQGVYVSDEEITKANKYFVDANIIPKYNDIFVIDEDEENQDGFGGDNPCANDPYYKKVKQWVITQQTISASGLQRKFSLGFPRAAKMIDALEQEGIISSSNGSKPRDVLVDYDPQAAIAEENSI